MHNKRDKRDSAQVGDDERVAFWGRAPKAVTALIGLAALAASVPSLARADFPLASLLIYVIGMGFVTMPLILFHEYLLKLHRERVAAD